MQPTINTAIVSIVITKEWLVHHLGIDAGTILTGTLTHHKKWVCYDYLFISNEHGAVGLKEGDFAVAVDAPIPMDKAFIVHRTVMGEQAMLNEYQLDGVRMNNLDAWHYLVETCGFIPADGLEYMTSLTMDAMAQLSPYVDDETID